MCPVCDLPWPVSCPLTQYSLSKSESPEHNCSRKAHLPAGRSCFTISSARANNANPVRVYSQVQHPAAQENMQSSQDVINMGNVFHYKIEKNIFHLSNLLNLVAYLIHKTHKMTNKKRVQHQKQPILNL